MGLEEVEGVMMVMKTAWQVRAVRRSILPTRRRMARDAEPKRESAVGVAAAAAAAVV